MNSRNRWFGTAVVFLVLILTVLSGCASGTNNRENEPQNAEAGNQEEVPAAAQEQPVELVFYAPAMGSFPAGVQDDPIAQEITRRTGVILNLVPENTVADYDAKLNAMLAGGDLPDLFMGREMRSKAISAKAVLAMDDYLAEYGKNMIEELPERLEFHRKFTNLDENKNSDGKIYYFGLRGESSNDLLQVASAFYIRWDLYKQLNYPKMETIDDVLNVTKSMLELEPTNKDGRRNYGLAYPMGESNWGLYGLYAGINEIYGYATDGYHRYMLDLANQTTVSPAIGDADSDYWKTFEFWNKAYRMGLLDPDSFTMKGDQFNDKADSGRYMLFVGTSRSGVANQNFINAGNPDKGYVQIPHPDTGRDAAYVTWNGIAGDFPIGISSKTKHPEKAVALLNFLASYEGSELLYNGIEGVHWDLVDGKSKMRPEVVAQYLADPVQFALDTGIGKYSNLAGRGANAINPQHGEAVNFFSQPDILKSRLNQVQKEACEYFACSIPAELVTKKFTHTVQDQYWTTFLPRDIPEEMTKFNNDMFNYINTNFQNLILADSEEKFAAAKQKVMADAQQLGVDAAYAFALEQHHILAENRQ